MPSDCVNDMIIRLIFIPVAVNNIIFRIIPLEPVSFFRNSGGIIRVYIMVQVSPQRFHRLFSRIIPEQFQKLS